MMMMVMMLLIMIMTISEKNGYLTYSLVESKGWVEGLTIFDQTTNDDRPLVTPI